MRVIVGVIAAVLAGLALATGVTVAVSLSSAPDKGINFDDVQQPDPWAGAVDYGRR
ncbi:MAG TPA: DUF2613 family protein [Actinophytocola sp.]|uniref:DUF2613 family protein n=1 Tax=Actinophytocola sp. TaxID=1872138 RepID=UPI002DDDB860|nr:DUF2613 family protein [Actinophytocola sp.]HEV2781644.1 DUF2613 family protein [Actinophytocola sp.]